MLRLILLSMVAITACNSPGRPFRGAVATRIAIGESVFDVRVRGNLAEAIRINTRYAPRLGPILDEAAVAMTYASGCDVTGVLGDQAVMIGVLECDTT